MEANGVLDMVSSDVRYVFRSDETDVDVTIEGKKEWVQGIVDELGLSDVGTMLPLVSNLIAGSHEESMELSLIHI